MTGGLARPLTGAGTQPPGIEGDATATVEGVPFVLTEDIGHRRTIGDVTFLNPFSDDFELAQTGVS